MLAAADDLDLDGLDTLPDDEELEAEELRRSFKAFAMEAWPVIEPGVELQWGRLQDAIAEHLEAVTLGQIRDLVINVRPRSSKSRLVSVLWPAWEWTRNPATRWLTASFALSNARDMSRLSLRLIRSEWYRRRFGRDVAILRELSAPSQFGNTRGGERIITANTAGVTGKGGERLLWDDPHDAKKAGSKADLAQALAFWRAFSSRRNNAKRDARIIIGQRVAASDVFAQLFAEGGWDVLKLATRFKAAKRCETRIGYVDPRTEEGEFLDPERHGEEEDRKARIELGDLDYSAQHDQEPSPEGGTTFKREDWRRWRLTIDNADGMLPDLDGNGHSIRYIPPPLSDGSGWRDYFDELVQSWDFTFKGEADSDWVVGQLWGRKGADAYLLAQVRERLDFVGARAALLNFSAAHPWAFKKLLEDAANGPAINAALKRDVPGMELVTTGGKSKPARARAVSPFQRSGNVWLPDDTVAHPWVPSFIERAAQFPRVDFDDEVDAMTQALNDFAAGWAELADALAIASGGRG